jgi:hypothetical protein
MENNRANHQAKENQMTSPNINRKWNEANGYDWMLDGDGRPIALTPHDHIEALARANRNPEDAAVYLGRCKWRSHSAAALWLLAGLAIGCVVMIVLSNAGRPA